jgi:hypothetical protein
MRWFHTGIDRLHVAVTRRLAPPVFRHGLDSPSLQQHLEAVQLGLPPLTKARHYTLTAHTLAGQLAAGVQLRRGSQPDLPVVIYHHGIAEMPYDKSFRGIFRTRLLTQAHVVAVRAPFHRSWFDLMRGLATLNNFMAMCAVSIKLIEAVRYLMIDTGARGCLVAGSSLGGFLAIVHHLIYGTADGYAPLLAGPDLAHPMLNTHCRRFLARQALDNPQTIKAQLDFRQAFQRSDTRRVFPLLARYDLHMPYAHHAACFAASHVPVVTIERGHITGLFTFSALRAHILACLCTRSP